MFKKRTWLFCVVIGMLLSLCVFSMEDAQRNISVGLVHGHNEKNQYEIEFPGGFSIGSLDNDSVFTASDSFQSSSAKVMYDGVALNIFADEKLADSYVSDVVLRPLEENGTFFFNGREYAGCIRFSRHSFGNMYVVNVVNLEDYIKGVLPSEFIPSWDKEALKAGAVAIRSYVLRNLGKHDEFDICAEVHCQVYKGRANATQKTDGAVEETAGVVLTYNNTIALATYYSSAIGSTESANNVWGTNLKEYPYLSGVDLSFVIDKYDSKGSWKRIVNQKELGTLTGLSDVINIKSEYADSGYLSKITLYSSDGEEKSASRSSGVRTLLNGLVPGGKFTASSVYTEAENAKGEKVSVITSQGISQESSEKLFVLSSDGIRQSVGLQPAFLFEGKGIGHGVGMSQYTCQALSEMGYSFEEILNVFYPGTSLGLVKDFFA